MSMSSETQAKFFMAMAKKAGNPNAPMTAAEDAVIAEYLGYAKAGGEAQGLPAGPAGDARGTNAMRRTNWFNGRFLTAEALRRQDSYFDQRARLDAHLLMPGVVHGLGVTAQGLNGMPVTGDGNAPPSAGGFGRTQTLTLSPGLAFDHVGRPILVSQPFPFTLEQLVATQRNTPRRVAPGGLEFAPCVCLVPDPAGPTGGSAAVRPGCYLLIIEPGEVPEGEAKVYGEACAGGGGATCQSESWRGAFGLSLVRVPLDLPEEEGLNTAWALRGTASAWWFDVFEHSLIRRWDPDFATDAGFARPVGPGRRENGAVALAMVWLGTDGSAIFLDSWIPRRSVVATPGEDWHRTRFGAPPRAASWARIHQFQAMLSESLDAAPLAGTQQTPRMNLWQRGFRHIPPIGFLPLDPAVAGAHADDFSSGNKTVDAAIAGAVLERAQRFPILERVAVAAGGRFAFVSGLIAGAREQAFSYFRGTTVLPYCVVALHDDDVLEDLGNVFDKDPVRVGRRRLRQLRMEEAERGSAAPLAPGDMTLKEQEEARTKELAGAKAAKADAVLQTSPQFGYVERLGAIFDELGLDELVNRRTEIVKVIIPLQGLTRPHPVLGVVPQDAQDQLADWFPPGSKASFGTASRLTDAQTMAGLPSRLPLEMLPRHFAVYVKQRMVLLDVLVMLLEMLQALVTVLRDMERGVLPADPDPKKKMLSTTQSYRSAWLSQPAEKRAIVEAAMAEPQIRDAMVNAATLSSADLRVPARNAAFATALADSEAALATQIADPTERQRVALERTTDAFAAEYPGFSVLQLVAAVQPAAQAKATIEAMQFKAAQQPLRDSSGGIVDATVADSLATGGPRIFAKEEAALAYASMNGALAEKSAASYAPGAPEGLSAKEIMAKPRAEAAAALGGDARLKAFTEAMAKEKAEAAAAAETLTAAPPLPEVTARLVEAFAKGQDATATLEAMKAEAGADAGKRAYLDATGTMLRTLGTERTLLLARSATIKRVP
jgi:hypothetical protein